MTLLAILSSGCEREVQACEVGGSAWVEVLAVPPGVEPDEVEGDGHGVVFQAGLGQSPVAGAASIGDLDRLGDCGLDSGSSGVGRLPGGGGLFGAGLVKGLLHWSGP